MADAFSVHDLVEAVDLSSIDYTEISAVRAETLPDDLDEDQKVDVNPTHVLNLSKKDGDGLAFRVGIRTEIDTVVGRIVVDVTAEYELSGVSAHDIPDDVMVDFINRAAAMTLVPYIRQGVADITQKVFGSPLLMPIMKQGELEFSLEAAVDVRNEEQG